MYMQIHVDVSCFSCSQKCKGRHVAIMVIVILYGTLCDHHLNNAIGPIVSESHAIQRLNEMVQASCCKNLLWKYKGAITILSLLSWYIHASMCSSQVILSRQIDHIRKPVYISYVATIVSWGCISYVPCTVQGIDVTHINWY